MARISSLIIAAGAAALVSAAVASATDIMTGDPSATNPSTIDLCGTRAEMVSRLADQFHENPLAVGQVNQSAVLEVFVSDTGTLDDPCHRDGWAQLRALGRRGLADQHGGRVGRRSVGGAFVSA